jgi:hypothetical protein
MGRAVAVTTWENESWFIFVMRMIVKQIGLALLLFLLLFFCFLPF